MIVYTDGSCSKNPNGVGAWCYVVCSGIKEEKKRIGRDYVTTSNKMELTAILMALRDLDGIDYIVSDSQYCVNCISGKWKAKANLDLILPCKDIIKKKKIELKWIRGHSGILGNELADRYANEEMKEAYKERNGVDYVAPSWVKQ